MSGQKKGKEAVLFPGERLDDLQLNGLELIQDPKKFCFGVDAVFLSDFVKINSSAYVVTLEFIFTKSAKASRISKIGLLFVFIEL